MFCEYFIFIYREKIPILVTPAYYALTSARYGDMAATPPAMVDSVHLPTLFKSN